MSKLYAYQPGYGSYSFFVMAESVEDAHARILEYCRVNDIEPFHYEKIEPPYDKKLGPRKVSNGTYELTILNPGEVIHNDNS